MDGYEAWIKTMKCKERKKPMRERTLLYATELGFEA